MDVLNTKNVDVLSKDVDNLNVDILSKNVRGCDECPPCQKQSYLNAWTVAIVIVSLLFVFYIRQLCVEHFKNKREKAEFVQKNMYPMFYGGGATYGKYKELVNDADAVEYYDLKKAFKQNKFTVDNIQKVL